MNFISGTTTPTKSTTAPTNGIESASLTAPKVPHKDKIIMTPSSWLLYDMSNPDVNTTDFLVEFYKSGEWAGEGKLGTTVDIIYLKNK